MDALREAYPDDGHKQLLNWQAQLRAFLSTISVGDLAILPLKTSPAVAIGEITGDNAYRSDLPEDAPRSPGEVAGHLSMLKRSADQLRASGAR
jgi:predicted Mrr-cat superfamily restriction endonuclease